MVQISKNKFYVWTPKKINAGYVSGNECCTHRDVFETITTDERSVSPAHSSSPVGGRLLGWNSVHDAGATMSAAPLNAHCRDSYTISNDNFTSPGDNFSRAFPSASESNRVQRERLKQLRIKRRKNTTEKKSYDKQKFKNNTSHFPQNDGTEGTTAEREHTYGRTDDDDDDGRRGNGTHL